MCLFHQEFRQDLSEELLELDEVTKLSRTRATVVGYNQRPLILGAVDETVFDLVKTDDISGNRKDFLKKRCNRNT